MEQKINIDRVIKGTFIGIGLLILTWYLLEGRKWSYLPDLSSGEHLGAQLGTQHGNPQYCFKTFRIFPSYPLLIDAQVRCVEEYAKMSRNPRSCLTIESESYRSRCALLAMKDMPCTLTSDQEIAWSEGPQRKVIQFSECSNNKNLSAVGSLCCKVARVAFIKQVTDCSGLASAVAMQNQCQFSLAFNTRSSKDCYSISDENIRDACLVITGALGIDAGRNPTLPE